MMLDVFEREKHKFFLQYPLIPFFISLRRRRCEILNAAPVWALTLAYFNNPERLMCCLTPSKNDSWASGVSDLNALMTGPMSASGERTKAQ